MKKILVFTFLMIAAISCQPQDLYYGNKYYRSNINPTEWFDGMNPRRLINLKGEIESITHLAYVPLGSDHDSLKLNSGTSSYFLKFDEKGKIVIAQFYHDNGNIGSESEYLDFYSGTVKSTKWFTKEGEFRNSEENIYSNQLIPLGIKKISNDKEETINFPVVEDGDRTVVETKFFEQEYLNRLNARKHC